MPLTSAITFEQSGQGSVLIIQEIRANLAADHRCSCECTLWYVNDSLNIFNTMSRKRLRGTAAKIRRFTADFTLQVACVVLVGCQTSADKAATASRRVLHRSRQPEQVVRRPCLSHVPLAVQYVMLLACIYSAVLSTHASRRV
jgi:hypothetical protein